MPGDYDIEYASPWAGATYLPSVLLRGPQYAEVNANPEYRRKELLLQNGIVVLGQSLNGWLDSTPKLESTSKVNPDSIGRFKHIEKRELPPGFEGGQSFTSVCINTAIYLPWLVSQCLKNGVIVKRHIFKHVAEAANVHFSGRKAHVVLNCTGLSAAKLGGVQDQGMMPARGQTVLVRNEADVMCSNSGTDDGDDEVCYTMQRAAGGGTLLGGSYQKGNWDSQIDPNLANRIMKRAVELCPALTGGKGVEYLSVIRHGVGLRPLRLGGPRIEKESINGVWIIHNYGHAGYGYQSSYGCSQAAIKLLEEALSIRPRL
ncbi:MAG: hypothetical protein Q9191_005652 [Dirinaria sp. TL-2023a]